MTGISRRAFLAAGSGSLGLLAGSVRSRGQGAEKLNIGLSPFINQATIFLARDLGYFSKVGLEIEMKVFPDGALVVAPMVSAELDIGVMTPNAGFFNSLYRAAPFRAFLCNGQGRQGRAVTALVIRSDYYEAGVRTLHDLPRLKGKIAAVGAAGSINQYSLGSALQLAGLDPVHDVQWQTSVAQPDIVKQLGQKQVDVAEITYHLAYLAQKRSFCRIMLSRDEILPDSQAAIQTVRDELLGKRRDAVVRYAMACMHAGRLFNRVASEPAGHPEMLNLIAKSIIPHDEELLKAVAPHWEWISEDGRPNVASIMREQDFWADTFRMVEHKVAQDRIIDLSIASEAAQRLAAEKPFGQG
ncbi:MAG TPA: ABC transporter substrate-binding protein [Xanthobacteraceae bacterium]|jgi:NitT/TauT family transport system substrate-binding protein